MGEDVCLELIEGVHVISLVGVPVDIASLFDGVKKVGVTTPVGDMEGTDVDSGTMATT